MQLFDSQTPNRSGLKEVIKSNAMLSAKIRNHTFDWMGGKFAPVIDGDHFLGHSPIGRQKWNLPPVNVKKKDQLFEMELMVPGYEKNELEIIVEDDILTVRGEKSDKNVKLSKYLLEEFGVSSFVRKFRLGEGIGREEIHAEYKNGLLKITFTDVAKEKERNYQAVEIA